MNHSFRIGFFGAALAGMFLTACGGEESVATRSARAFREAQEKGVTVGGDSHGHGAPAEPVTETRAAMDHSSAEHATVDHAGMEHSPTDHAAVQHTAAAHRADGHAVSGHAAAAHPASHAASGHAGADHSGMGHSQKELAPSAHATMDHVQHGRAAAGAPAALPAVPSSSEEMLAMNPAATLQPDALDAPSPVSVAEAEKAANNIPDGDVRHIVPGTDQENPPTPRSSGTDGHTGHENPNP